MADALRGYVPPRRPLRGAWVDWTSPLGATELAATAYHEAAHALVMLATTCDGPYRVTIRADAEKLGEARYVRRRATRPDEAASDAAVSLAGHVAEHLWFDGMRPEDWYGIGDVCGDSDATEAAALLENWFAVPDEAWWRVCEGVRCFLNRRNQRLAIGRIVRLLHEHETIDRSQLAGVWKPHVLDGMQCIPPDIEAIVPFAPGGG